DDGRGKNSTDGGTHRPLCSRSAQSRRGVAPPRTVYNIFAGSASGRSRRQTAGAERRRLVLLPAPASCRLTYEVARSRASTASVLKRRRTELMLTNGSGRACVRFVRRMRTRSRVESIQ